MQYLQKWWGLVGVVFTAAPLKLWIYKVACGGVCIFLKMESELFVSHVKLSEHKVGTAIYHDIRTSVCVCVYLGFSRVHSAT